MDHEYQPGEDRAQDQNLCALSCGRDDACAACLREIDRAAEQGLDITGTAHVDQLYVKAIFFEYPEIFGDPERRIGVTKSGERRANLLQRLSGKQMIGSEQDRCKKRDNESLQRVIHTCLVCQLRWVRLCQLGCVSQPELSMSNVLRV